MKALLTLLFPAVAAAALQVSSTVVFDDGIHVEIRTRFGNSSSGLNQSTTSEGKSIVRLLSDGRRPVFGYILEVTRADSENRFRMIVWPYAKAPTFERMRAMPVLRYGDEVSLDLMVNPSTGERVTDIIRILGTRGQADSQVYELGLDNVRVTIDGATASHEAKGVRVRGDGVILAWVPGYGSFFFSTRPMPGCDAMKIGNVNLNELRFQLNNSEYRFLSQSRILGRATHGEVWVCHVGRKARPEWGEDAIGLAAAGSVADLISAQ